MTIDVIMHDGAMGAFDVRSLAYSPTPLTYQRTNTDGSTEDIDFSVTDSIMLDVNETRLITSSAGVMLLRDGKSAFMSIPGCVAIRRSPSGDFTAILTGTEIHEYRVGHGSVNKIQR